jgi:MSHA biogenesis protein MshP
MKKQAGFSLLSAIFILAVLAVISAFVLDISAVSRSTATYSLQGQRAYFAAKSGVDWGIYKIVTTPSACPATTTINLTQGGLNGFSVQVTCSVNSFTEGTTNYNMFTITGFATKGSFGSADYVSRRVQVIATLAF